MLVMFGVFPPEKRGQTMEIYVSGVVLAPALGPTIGGLLVDNLSWRYVFFMTLPFCLIGMGLASLLFAGRRYPHHTPSAGYGGIAPDRGHAVPAPDRVGQRSTLGLG